jgi:hypothetical protein
LRMQFALGMGCTSSVARGGELVGGGRGWKEAAPNPRKTTELKIPAKNQKVILSGNSSSFIRHVP